MSEEEKQEEQEATDVEVSDSEVKTEEAPEPVEEAPETSTEETESVAYENEAAADEGSVEAPELPDFTNMLAEAAASSIELLNDVELDVKVELGRSELTVEQVLNLTEGSVVELDKLAGDPVDVFVNEQLVARGEILVVNDNFCVRLNEIVPGVSERMTQE